MKFSTTFFRLLAVVALTACSAKVQADVLISNFSSPFALTGTYVEWGSGTFTSNPTDFRVQANDFGGGFLNTAVNGGTNNALQLIFNVNAANVSTLMNVVLIDGDGTERVYRFDGLTVGAQNRTTLLSNFLQDNQPGTVAGLNIANITAFHLQGTFTNGQPGLLMDQSYDNLAFVTVIPEPGSLLVFGASGLALLLRRRRSS